LSRAKSQRRNPLCRRGLAGSTRGHAIGASSHDGNPRGRGLAGGPAGKASGDNIQRKNPRRRTVVGSCWGHPSCKRSQRRNPGREPGGPIEVCIGGNSSRPRMPPRRPRERPAAPSAASGEDGSRSGARIHDTKCPCRRPPAAPGRWPSRSSPATSHRARRCRGNPAARLSCGGSGNRSDENSHLRKATIFLEMRSTVEPLRPSRSYPSRSFSALWK
jgi:hypothetical protein